MKRSNLLLAAVVIVVLIVGGFIAYRYSAPAAPEHEKVAFGKTTASSGFHLPSYVAFAKGIFAREGLDVTMPGMTGSQLVKAEIAGELDFVPIPVGGSIAILNGAHLKFVVGEVGQSLWILLVKPDIKSPADLKGKVLGLGQPGSADYDEPVFGLEKYFDLKPGRDYNVVTVPDEVSRITGMVQGSIDAGPVTPPHAARGEQLGLKPLIKFGDYIKRLGGTVLTTNKIIDEKPEVVKRVTISIVKAIQYIKSDREGTVEVIEKYFGLEAPTASKVYDLTRDAYSPLMEPNLIRVLFGEAAHAAKWQGPLPDLDKFIDHRFLDEALKTTGYS